MGTSIKITSRCAGKIDKRGIKSVRTSVISVQSVEKKIKKYTTDNTEIHGFRIHGPLVVFYISCIVVLLPSMKYGNINKNNI